ncbi:MAG: hypothetical protein Q8Q12_14855 [bacterium]|nr:hypothetical protein [bacterium]
MDLLEELTHLLRRLEDERVEYALCGGLAMAIYAFPRATLDIDIMIEPESLATVKALAKDLGFSVDVGLLEFKEGAIRIYRLTKLPAGSPDALVLDLVLVTAQIKEVWDDRRRLEWEGGTLSVVSPRGLITLKSMRNSGQDRDDIEHLRSILDED